MDETRRLREVLPISSGVADGDDSIATCDTRVVPELRKLPRGERVTIASQPAKRVRFRVERLFVSNHVGCENWTIYDIRASGKSMMPLGRPINGAAFGTAAHGLHHEVCPEIVEIDGVVEIDVAYVGPLDSAAFIASTVGTSVPEFAAIVKTSLSLARPVRRSEGCTMRGIAPASYRPEQLDIDAEPDAASWLIDDVRIDGETIFAQRGAVPADMFATSAIDSFPTARVGAVFEIDVRYCGDGQPGNFKCDVVGTASDGDIDETIEAWGQRVGAWKRIVDDPRAGQSPLEATRDVKVVMRSTRAIAPGEIGEVIVRPPYLAYRIDEIRIEAARAWRWRSLRIGGREQIETLFSSVSCDVPIEILLRHGELIDTAQTQMDIVLLVQNTSNEPRIFDGMLVGAAAVEPTETKQA